MIRYNSEKIKFLNRVNTFLTCSILLIFFTLSSTAQENYFIGTLPNINLTKNINSKWGFNFFSEMRLTVTQDKISRENYSGNFVQLTDFAIKPFLNISENSYISGGYLIRFKNDLVYHRAIQQLSVKKTYKSIILSHRFLSDQTYNSVNPWLIRLRYRCFSEISLKNQTTNSSYFYIKPGSEFLNTWIRGNPGIDIYFMPLAGFEFKNKNRLEFGSEYWMTDVFTSNLNHIFWLNIGIFIKI